MSSDVQALAEEVQSGQRSDPAMKVAWVTYCDTQWDGTKDPRRHTAESLAAFLNKYRAGGLAVGSEHVPPAGDHQAMVDQVKVGQRSDPAFKQAWVQYCDTQYDGTKDPSRHTAESLHLFLVSGAQGHDGASQQAAGGPLVEQVKAAKRSDPSVKEAWMHYCNTYGDGTMDPARHTEDSLRQFLSTVGQGGQPPPRPMGKGMQVHRGPPQNVTAPVAAGAQLVEQIKTGQRYDPAFKEAWNTFCDAYCEGIRDPHRHPTVNLTLFLSQQGPAKGGAPGVVAGKSKGKGSGIAPTPDVAALADQVKGLQRSDPATKAAWVQYCDTPPNDGTKDPARHSAESLKAFLAQHGGGAAYGAWPQTSARPRAGPY
jgi:hypothetical protein